MVRGGVCRFPAGRVLLEEGVLTSPFITGASRVFIPCRAVFCQVMVVASAQVRRDGRVQAQGSPVAHATLGPLEEWLEHQAGPGVIGQIADRAVLRKQYVKGERERLLARAFMIRVIVLMTLMPDADVREALIALAGGPGDGAVGAGLGAGVGAGVRGLAERARPGTAGRTAGRRAAYLAPGA